MRPTPLRLSCYRLAGRVPVPGTHRRCRSDLPGLGRGRGSRVRRPAGACHPSTTKGTAMTIVEDARVITGGVDTHTGLHVAAALDRIGGLLGVQEFPATAAGYASLLDWLSGFGDIALVGVEGTGSYGAGLARHLAAAGVRVVEVDRADRQDRHRRGKSDPLLRREVARSEWLCRLEVRLMSKM